MKPFFWLASYPKSGNTWVRLALSCLRVGSESVDINNFQRPADSISASRTLFDQMMGIDSADLTTAEILSLRPMALRLAAAEMIEPVIWKAHESNLATPPAEPLFPAEITRGALYIVRDPRDVALSLAYHRSSTVDRVIDDMANPDFVMAKRDDRLTEQLPQPLGHWSQHVESWRNAAFPVTLVRYEDLLTDTVATLGRIAQAVGLHYDQTLLARAAAATRFETLQQQEQQHGFSEKPRTMTRFFRSGQAGTWRTALTPAQSDRILADHGAVMASLGYR